MCGGPILADSGNRWIAICTREQLAAQKIVCTMALGVGVLVIEDGNKIVACERACPHEQADLSRGHVAQGRLHCPHHRASFDLATGQVSPGWPTRPLRRFPVLVDDVDVWIDTQLL